MSVYASNRSNSIARYLEESRDIRRESIQIAVKFPKKYNEYLIKPIMDAANNLYTDCIKSNSIFLNKYISDDDYRLRHRYLMTAFTNLQSLIDQIDFLYEFVDRGNNFLDSKVDYLKRFQRWISMCDHLVGTLSKLIQSDKDRYAKYQKELQEERELAEMEKHIKDEKFKELDNELKSVKDDSFIEDEDVKF